MRKMIVVVLILFCFTRVVVTQELQIKPKEGKEFKFDLGFFEGLNQKRKFFQFTPRYQGEIVTNLGKISFNGFVHFSRRSFFSSHTIDFQLPQKASFFSFNLKEDVTPWGRNTVFRKAININEIPGVKEKINRYFKSLTIQQFSPIKNIIPSATDFSWESRQLPMGRYVGFSSSGYYSVRNQQPDYFRSNFTFQKRNADTFHFGPEIDFYGPQRNFKFVLKYTL